MSAISRLRQRMKFGISGSEKYQIGYKYKMSKPDNFSTSVCRVVAVATAATTYASNVWTATATASHICVVANPSWNVRLYAAAATDPSKAACLAQTE